MKKELENELKYLLKIKSIMLDNRVFISEEITVIEDKINDLEAILSVLVD